jgi:hypothetical protein
MFRMDYETRQEEKRRAESRKEMRRMIRRMVPWVIAIVAAAALVWGIARWVKSQAPVAPDRSVEYPNQGQVHIEEGSPRPDYNSNPPTSGPHYAQPAKAQYYDHEVPDERLVHNLEHGEIWISYKPSLPQSAVDELKKLADGVFVVIAPRAANETDIALAAWTRLDKFNLENGALDLVRIRDFILRYRDRGPEKVHSMTGIPQ